MKLKMILLGVVSAVLLMSCAPTTAGSSTLAPIVVKDSSEVVVAEGQTVFVQKSIRAALTGFTDEAADASFPPFTYDELSDGNSKQAVLDRNRFKVEFMGQPAQWNLKVESVILVRTLSNVRVVGNAKDYRYSDTLNVIYSFNAPKGSAGQSKFLIFNLNTNDTKSGFGLVSLNVRVN